MDITTNDDWQWADESYEISFATTNDPRVVAVIQRDGDASVSQCFDGDAILGVYSIEYRGEYVTTPQGGYGGDEWLAQRILNARSRFQYAVGYRYDGMSAAMLADSYALLLRWAWVFHRTAFTIFSRGGDEWLVLNSADFREHVGWGPCTQEEAQASTDAMVDEVENVLDGNVFGVGYATNIARVMDDGEPIDLNDMAWTVSIECWGFVGEDYAKATAGAFEYGEPILEPMLDDFDVFGDAKRVIEERL